MDIHLEPSPVASGDFRDGGLTEAEAFAKLYRVFKYV